MGFEPAIEINETKLLLLLLLGGIDAGYTIATSVTLRCLSVCLPVCLSVSLVHPAKAVVQNVTLFGKCTPVAPSNTVLDRGLRPPGLEKNI